MKKLLAVLALTALAAAPAAAGAKRYLVGFREGTTSAQREASLKTLGASVVDDLSEIGSIAVEVPEDALSFRSFEAQAQALPDVLEVYEDVEMDWDLEAPSFQASPLPALGEVLSALPRFHAKAALPPVFPLPPGIDADEVPWGIARVNAPGAWAITQGEGVKVAVIDTGIDCGHPDLKANCAGGYNAISSSKPPMDDNRHGTHVAGTIAGVLDGKGVVGVAPKARLYAVKVLNKSGRGGLVAIIKGLIWAGKNHMDVANMSLGTPTGIVFMRMAIKYAQARNVLVVAAAGNSGGRVNYPAAYPGVIAVSAMASDETIPQFSSRGRKVGFIAPGVAVKSSVPGGGYDFFRGTSMASPHVAGLAALAIARGARGADQVQAALRRAAKPIAGLKEEEQGAGVVDAALLAR